MRELTVQRVRKHLRLIQHEQHLSFWIIEAPEEFAQERSRHGGRIGKLCFYRPLRQPGNPG